MYRINFLPMYGKSCRYLLFAPWCKKYIVCLNIQSFYLTIKVWVLSNQIIIVISCKEGSKAISPHFKSTLQKYAFFSNYISPETLLCCKKQDYVVTNLYCIVFKRNICALFWRKKVCAAGLLLNCASNAWESLVVGFFDHHQQHLYFVALGPQSADLLDYGCYAVTLSAAMTKELSLL